MRRGIIWGLLKVKQLRVESRRARDDAFEEWLNLLQVRGHSWFYDLYITIKWDMIKKFSGSDQFLL